MSSTSEHLARYLFCRNYVKGLMLDVAAGPCYGSSVLALDFQLIVFGKIGE